MSQQIRGKIVFLLVTIHDFLRSPVVKRNISYDMLSYYFAHSTVKSIQSPTIEVPYKSSFVEYQFGWFTGNDFTKIHLQTSNRGSK